MAKRVKKLRGHFMYGPKSKVNSQRCHGFKMNFAVIRQNYHGEIPMKSFETRFHFKSVWKIPSKCQNNILSILRDLKYEAQIP